MVRIRTHHVRQMSNNCNLANGRVEFPCSRSFQKPSVLTIGWISIESKTRLREMDRI